MFANRKAKLPRRLTSSSSAVQPQAAARHTHITLALSGEPHSEPAVLPVPPHIVAGRVGDDPKTILATYAHLLPQSDEQAAEGFASLLVDRPLTNEVVSAP
jgi:hypothetical protein